MSRDQHVRGTETDIFRVTSEFNDIVVTERGFIRTLSFGGHRQSSMYLDAPFDTDFEYPGYFHLALAVVPGARRALAVGLGGGTVVKRMWRDYPAMRVDAVEIDPAVVDVARRYFELPDDERIRVFVDSGRHFVETCSETYDVVVIDAFDGDEVPPELADAGFMLALREHVSPGGAVAYNVMGAVDGVSSVPFSALHRRLSESWRRVWVFVVDEGVAADGLANLIVLATDAQLTTDGLRTRIANRVDGRVSVPAFHRFGEDLWEPGPAGINRQAP